MRPELERRAPQSTLSHPRTTTALRRRRDELSAPPRLRAASGPAVSRAASGERETRVAGDISLAGLTSPALGVGSGVSLTRLMGVFLALTPVRRATGRQGQRARRRDWHTHIHAPAPRNTRPTRGSRNAPATARKHQTTPLTSRHTHSVCALGLTRCPLTTVHWLRMRMLRLQLRARRPVTAAQSARARCDSASPLEVFSTRASRWPSRRRAAPAIARRRRGRADSTRRLRQWKGRTPAR